jgi:hypothetical protein
MAYVPGFANDLFISYAQIDNRPEPGIDDSCWITHLRNGLQTGLDQRLGRTGMAKIWMDMQGLQGNASVTPAIHQAITSTAVLVIVLSQGSLSSPWCREEWTLFEQAAGGPEQMAGRVFIVLPDELSMDAWPASLQDRIGYRFYTKSPDGEIVNLGKPKPTVEQQDYFLELSKLRKQLADQLKKMGAQTPAPEKSSVVFTPQPKAMGSVAPAPAADNRVFLANVSGDLDDDRYRLEQALKNAGYQVMPEGFYPREPGQFRAKMTADLAGCSLYVQLLGPFASRAGETQTYEGLQAEVAQSVFAKDADKMLLWRNPTVDPTRAKFADHLALLQSPAIQVMDLEELKTIVLTRLKRQRDKVERSADDVNRMLLINAIKQDRELAEQLTSELEGAELDFDVIFEDQSVVDVAKATPDVHGLMVVFGNNGGDWASDQIRKMRSLVLEKKAAAPRCAVYVSPPEDRKLLVNFRQLVHIKSKDDLKQFLNAIRAGGPSA